MDDDPLYRLGHPVELVTVQRGVHHGADAFAEDPEVVAGDAVAADQDVDRTGRADQDAGGPGAGTATFCFDEGEVARSIGSPRVLSVPITLPVM